MPYWQRVHNFADGISKSPLLFFSYGIGGKSPIMQTIPVNFHNPYFWRWFKILLKTSKDGTVKLILALVVAEVFSTYAIKKYSSQPWDIKGS